jgi:hypothetical protein
MTVCAAARLPTARSGIRVNNSDNPTATAAQALARYNVIEIEPSGAFRHIGPASGFGSENEARIYAETQATSSSSNHSEYVVVLGHAFAVYQGRGLRYRRV